MTDRIQIKPTEQNLDRWMRVFVPPTMLWWWDNSPIPNAGLAIRIVPRARLGTEPLLKDIVYVNAFHSWAMSKEVSYVIVDNGEWSDNLSEDDRSRASALQVRFKRGLCPPRERFGEVELSESTMADGRVVLDYSLWRSLADYVKRNVVEAELRDWDRDCSHAISVDTPEHIASVANSFVHREGINCLSVTAFAITARQDDLYQWMQPESFNSILRNYEYTESEAESPSAGDVIVFRDEDGNVVHAAYALGSDRILNKNGQTSFNPIAIVNLETLKEDWREYSPTVHRILP